MNTQLKEPICLTQYRNRKAEAAQSALSQEAPANLATVTDLFTRRELKSAPSELQRRLEEKRHLLTVLRDVGFHVVDLYSLDAN